MLGSAFVRQHCVLALATILISAQLASPTQAESSACSGTHFQLALQHQGESPVARFRFSLALSGEGASEAEAMQQLNRRLDRLRREIKPLVIGRLTVPAPHSHPRGRGSERRFMAITAASGEVSSRNYNRLIQAVGVLPGVRQQGMQSIADPEAEASLQQRLMRAALQRGQAEAEATARALGVSTIKLLSIMRQGDVRQSRPMQLQARANGFDPSEAPEVRSSVRLELQYCLS